MMNRLRGALGLDAVVPVVLIAAALLMTLDPTMFGVAVSERQIVLAFFGFLGIDTLIERTGRLRRPLTQRGLRQRRHVGRAVHSTSEPAKVPMPSGWPGSAMRSMGSR